ncbi:MAG: chromate transporter [Clostridia bacterium]|nr:chromate transporter [Clostridia bacterium]
MPLLLDLFLTFLKIGVVSFGGGYAMIPLLTDEVLVHAWLTEAEILNFIAVSESTPGPVAINMATFIGASQGGFIGAILATLGVVLPAFSIILLIASVIGGLLKYAGVKAFLNGVRPVVTGLITATGLWLILSVTITLKNVYTPIDIDYKAIIIFGIIAVTHIVYKKITKKKISPILLIILSAVLGIVLYGLL